MKKQVSYKMGGGHIAQQFAETVSLIGATHASLYAWSEGYTLAEVLEVSN